MDDDTCAQLKAELQSLPAGSEDRRRIAKRLHRIRRSRRRIAKKRQDAQEGLTTTRDDRQVKCTRPDYWEASPDSDEKFYDPSVWESLISDLFTPTCTKVTRRSCETSCANFVNVPAGSGTRDARAG